MSRQLFGWLALLAALSGCSPTAGTAARSRVVEPWTADLASASTQAPPQATSTPTPDPDPLSWLSPTRVPGQPYPSPTADAVRPLPPLRTSAEYHTIQPGENLSAIAYVYGVSPSLIMQANGLANPNYLPVWATLTIPPPRMQPAGPAVKLLPDSGFVYGPAAILSNVEADAGTHGGYLTLYAEEIEGQLLSGPQIVQLTAQQYSVAPRLLMALLEHQSGWLTSRSPSKQARSYPMGYVSAGYDGLYAQLSWAANSLNLGYYRWRAGWAGPFLLADGSSVPPGAGINAATAAVQGFFANLLPYDTWRATVGDQGFEETYRALFGDPFQVVIEPYLPADLTQPLLRLPFEDGKVWSFTGGPHSAWGSGAAWAALDFAPPGNALGCVPSDEWVTSMSDGVVLRSENGEVVVDLDLDGYEQTGWVVLYMHVDTRDRVHVGARLSAGDRIGHPSCEGGVSNGTHVHIARKYNGEWIPADGKIPFELDDWVSAGLGREYDGTMTRGDVTLEACSCRNDENQIGR